MDIENFKNQLPAPAEQSIEGVTETPLPAPGGRPTKLTPQVIDDIVKWLKLGFYQEEAAVMAGTSKTTYYDWLRAGKDGDNRFSEFSVAVERARAEAEGAHIMNIRKAADNGVWQASSWFLARSHPKKWGKKNPDLLGEESDEPIEFEIKYADG